MKRQKNKIKNARPPVAADPLAELKKTPAGRAYLARATAALDAQSKSSDVVLPGPLAAAFGADGSATVEGFKILPMSLYLPALLEQIESPLIPIIKIYREAMAQPVAVDEATAAGQAEAYAQRTRAARDRIAREVKDDGAANLATIFCFLTPSAELEQLLCAGRDKFDAAARALLKHVPLVTLNKLMSACSAHYGRNYATVIQYGGAVKEGEVFIKPPAATKTV